MKERLFVVNPRAGGNRTGRRWRRIDRFLRARGLTYDAVHTAGPGHATQITRAALTGGCRTIVAVGGDGTLNEIVNGFLHARRPVASEAKLGILPVGTGSDFVKTARIPDDAAKAAALLESESSRAIDVGAATFRDAEGGTHARYFVNIAEFGSGGAVMDRVNRSWKILGRRATFTLGILRTLPGYRNTRAEYASEDGSGHVVFNDFVVANGRFFGGGLQPAPHADLEDGLLDVVIIGDVDFRTVRRNLGKLREGTHLSLPQVTSFRTDRLRVTTRESVLLEMDGESVGRDPTEFVCVPRVLNAILPEKGE